MIIVSQDKEEIIILNNVLNIVITDETDEIEKYSLAAGMKAPDDNYRILGYYKTKERAKEVLKEICDFYEVEKRHECSGNSGITIYISDKFVYEMPEK